MCLLALVFTVKTADRAPTAMKVPGRKSMVTTEMVLIEALSCMAYLVIFVLD